MEGAHSRLEWRGMAGQAVESWPEETRFESAGCCGVVARLLIMGALVVSMAVMAVLLVMQPPERWQGAADPAAHPLAIITDPQRPLTVYVATEQGRALISHDGGANWAVTTRGLPASTPISALTLLPGGNALLAGTSAGAYLSMDQGQTWRPVGSGLPSHVIVDAVGALPDGTLLAGTTSRGVWVLPAGAATWLAASGLPPQSDIYAFLPAGKGGQALAALVSGGVYASQNGGKTWAESDRGISGASGVNVFSFLAVPGSGDAGATILAGTSRGVFVSRDHGVSWTRSSAGIGTARVLSLARDPLTPSDVFAGADSGVFQSTDSGATWRPVGFGLPAGQHVGAVGVIHPAGGARVLLAAVDQLYLYPGRWPLATQPWRTLGTGAIILLAVALVALIIQWARVLLAQ